MFGYEQVVEQRYTLDVKREPPRQPRITPIPKPRKQRTGQPEAVFDKVRRRLGPRRSGTT